VTRCGHAPSRVQQDLTDNLQPFAFASREFLRDLLVGKAISFETLYQVPTTKREYGKVRLPNGSELPDLLVSEGWAKVREDAGRKEDDEGAVAYPEKLRDLEGQAKASSKGVWATSGGKIDTSYEVPDPSVLVEEYSGKKVDAIVERVLTGDRMIVRLLVSPEKHIQTMLVLAGVRTPSTKRTSPDGKEVPAEPYGTEAHHFVEERLHQRKCAVQLLGVTPQKNLIGSVLHPRGNIAKFLLEAGLAKCHDQHVTMLGNEMAQFRQAEKAAKDSKKGLFTGHTAAKAAGTTEADYTVVRVLNADTIFIRTRSGEEKKINLSSVRQPKPSDPKQSTFSADAKEFLRKRLIGKHVKVTIDGKKAASEGYEEREVATVTVNGKNVALMLVEAGYASVIRHRRDDDDRSPDYDALLLAEENAQKEEKGMWSPKAPAIKQYQDYSESLQKAKMEASVLQRQKKVPAIVDFVRSGSRFVVLVPRENAKLTFVLSGIKVPKSARNPGDASEPFGQEAHDLANRRCMQRDVEIDVENTDKVGGFIGTMYVGRDNFARVLVEEGLAEVHAYSAEQSGHANELFAAEKKAKEEKKGMWHNWDPSKNVDEEPVSASNGTDGPNGDAALSGPRPKDYRDIMVTHVDESGKLKIQQVGTGTAALTELMTKFKSFHLDKKNDQSLPGPPKVGDVVAAKFTVDNDWYRARVRRVDREGKKADVTYLDYGNSETIPWTRLRPLSQPQFSTQTLKPQAADAVLSYLQFPRTVHYLEDAVAFISQQTDGRQLVANVDYISDATLYITLMSPESNLEQSINAEVIREGLAMVPRKLKAWEKAASDTVGRLKKLEEEAKEGRLGMWEYGELDED
jgi:staphylococcal nuclease domain-containing protein 1